MTSPIAGRPSRMLVITAFISLAAGLLTMATFEFMLVAVQADLGISFDQANAAMQIPAAASLCVVFLVGSLGDRLGRRRVLIAGSIAFLVGAALVAIATNLTVLTIGRAFGGIGGTMMGITGLAILNASFTDDRQRARVFGAFAALTPALFIVSPLIGSLMVDNIGWRSVPILWIAASLGAVLMAWAFVPTSPPAGERSELITPLLAGIALSGIGIAATAVSGERAVLLGALVIALVAVIATAVLMRRLARPTLDLRVLRARGAWLVVIALLVAPAANLFFFTNLLLQLRFAYALVVIAALLVIPQVAAVCGGLLGGSLSVKWGAPYAAVAALTAAAFLGLGVFIYTPTSPAWVPVVILAIAAVPIAGAVGPLTKSLLDLAPSDGSGAASAVQNALWSMGAAVGGVMIGLLVFGSFQSSLTAQLDTTSLTSDQANAIAAEVRDGAVLTDLVQRLPVSDVAATQVLVGDPSGVHQAQADAFHFAGSIAFVTNIAAAGAMLAFARRRRSAALQ